MSELSPEEIEANRNNPELLLRIVATLTKAIKLDEKKQIKMRQLRWEVTRQMHYRMPKFWLEEVKGQNLIKIFQEWCKEYQKIFKDPYPHYDVIWRDAKDWKALQKTRYEKAQE